MINIERNKVSKMSVDVVKMLEERRMTRVCAPMVRYSKLAFRSLVRRYDCDICFTPMILADSFVQSARARENEFATNDIDKPLIVQFAANNPDDFADASELVSPYSNGVDLNCGCPQRWAINEGYGCDLLKKPWLIKDLVSQVRNRIGKPFTVSVKIRLLPDIKKTVELCRTLEKAGLSFLTVHARTPQMRKEPIDLEGLKLVRDNVRIPLIANGDVKSLFDAKNLYDATNSNGIMAANGILANPAMFTGESTTPLSCVQDWIDITETISTQFLCFHHHLIFMLDKVLPKPERLTFNTLGSRATVLSFLEDYYGIRPAKNAPEYLKPIVCNYDDAWLEKRNRKIVENEEDSGNDPLGNLFSEIL